MPQTAPEGWALVDIEAVGLCGTDYHIFQGEHPYLNYPRVIGHELSGRIADGTETWEKGALAVVNPYVSCGKCHACRRGKPNCCMQIEVFGVHRDGGFCHRVAVPESNLYPAGSLTPIEAAMVEFLAIGAHAVYRSEIAAGDRVLVVGIGPIGLGTALFARLRGADVHVLDASPERLQTAASAFGLTKGHEVGADILGNGLQDGFDAVFDATGNATAMQAGFPLVAHGGSYVLVSVVKDEITFDDAAFHKREMRVIGSRNALKSDFETVMEALRTKKIDSDALCSQVLGLDEIEARFPELAADRSNLIKAIVRIAA